MRFIRNYYWRYLFGFNKLKNKKKIFNFQTPHQNKKKLIYFLLRPPKKKNYFFPHIFLGHH
jgi:hypothetical protein